MEKPSVLVVEDDENVLDAICRVVEDCGCHAIGAGSYRQALACAKQSRVNAAITDWDLNGDKSGVDIGRDLQQTKPEFLLVFITGKSVEKLRMATSDLSVFQIVEKPVSLKKLRTLVCELAIIASRD